MLEIWLWCSAIAVILGLVLGALVHWGKIPISIPWWEYVCSGLVLVLVLGLGTAWVGYKIAYSHNVTYNEFWGGYELKAYPVTYQCHESPKIEGNYDTGGCTNYYEADEFSYQVWVHSESCTTDSKGNQHCVDTSHWETRWQYRRVPYTDTETSWMVETSLGTYTIGDHWLPANPSAHRVRPQYDAMRGLDTSLPSGVPQQWQAAHDRIAAGTPGPVTAQRQYPNYILASENHLLTQRSGDIKMYQQTGLMPELKHDVNFPYYLDRVYFAGVKVQDPAAWQWHVNKFDAALGGILQGNLYVVVVDANKVPSSQREAYLEAVVAYWQSQHFGKDAVSKNAVILILGTKDGETVDWAKGLTGMPSGNEFMLGELMDKVPGTKLDPQALFGNPNIVVPPEKDPKSGFYHFKLAPEADPGIVEQIMLIGPNHFVREHMGSYAYLSGQIKPTPGETAVILIVYFLLALGGWAALAFYIAPALAEYRTGTSRADSPWRRY
jgi:hypothetical protein